MSIPIREAMFDFRQTPDLIFLCYITSFGSCCHCSILHFIEGLYQISLVTAHPTLASVDQIIHLSILIIEMLLKIRKFVSFIARNNVLSLIERFPNCSVMLYHFSLYYKLILSCRNIQPVGDAPDTYLRKRKMLEAQRSSLDLFVLSASI